MDIVSSKKINYNLEILRGFSALIVIISHVIYHNTLFNPHYFPNSLKPFDPPAHLAVLIFFMLSGYVIGINHESRLTDKKNILLYLKKRFIRIYPIYLISIILGLVISLTTYPWITFLSNLTLTQNIFSPVIWENNPAWSLNYEVLYYLLFIPISFFDIKPIVALGVFFLIGVISIYCPVNPIISAYSIGYCFWLTGLSIAQNLKADKQGIKLIPLLLYIMAIDNITSGTYISRLISIMKQPIPGVIQYWSQNIISIDELISLPFCFVIVLFFSGKDFKYKKYLFLLIQTFPLYVIYAQIKHPTHDIHHFYVGIIYLILACLSYFINIPEGFIRKVGIKLGSWSYGIYIIHFPILFLFGRITVFSDNLLYYIIRVILYLSIVLFSAWFLERKLQPVFKNWLSPKLHN